MAMWRKQARVAPTGKAEPSLKRTLYRAVSVLSPAECCASAKAVKGRRFLEAEAPTLPLPNCSMPFKCKCRFQKHPDRRDGENGRRLGDVTQRAAWEQAVWYAGPELRKTRGRRKDEP